MDEHVLAELTRLDTNQQIMNVAIGEVKEDVSSVHGDIKLLYFKAGLVGLVGGAIPALIALALTYIK